MNTEERLSKLEKNKSSTFANIALGILFVVLVLYLIFMAVKSFMPQEEPIIKFEIVGIVNDTNVTTLTQIHLECIKYCIIHVNTDYNHRNDCYDQCSLLGKEETK